MILKLKQIISIEKKVTFVELHIVRKVVKML